MDSSPPHAVNITNAVVQDSIGQGIGSDIHQPSPTLSNPSQELIQQQQYTSNHQMPLGGNNQVSLDYTEQQHQQMLMYLREQRAQFKSWRIKCFICQTISFLFAFITEQVTNQHFSVAVTTGLISIIFGFPIPIVFFNIVLKKYAMRSRTGPQHSLSGAQVGVPNRRDGFFERQIFAMVMYMAAIVTATILLYEGLNREYKVVGMVIVTASFLVFSTLLIYVDLIDDEIEE